MWLDRQKTQECDIYIDKDEQKWFKCRSIYNIADINGILEFSEEKNLDKEERVRLGNFHTLIFNTKDESKINFYLEENQSPNKAVNIFIRINSNGEPLDYSDILFSIAIANWSKIDARTEINTLVDRINQNFKISKDLILKGFLYLFHENIKFQIDSFDTSFIHFVEKKWEGIKNSFIETFRLLRSFGFDEKTLSSNNAVLPILYFIYHKNLAEKIVNSVHCKTNRELIRKWILRAIVLKPFGASGDTVLANMRRAFIKDFKQNIFFDREIELFPATEIEKEAKYSQKIDREYLVDNIIYCRKNSPEAFAVLSMLYPNLDYKNNIFHKDHLHPENSYKEYEKYGKKKYELNPEYQYWSFEVYDSLVNLQMLDANENMSKQDISLQEWVDKNCGQNRQEFLEKHLIPNVDLSLENFDDFVEKRKELLIQKLEEILC